MTLERLSPLERAAFLLHDVFDVDFDAVAATLGRSQDACRQLASRARAHLKSELRVQPAVADGAHQRLAEAFRDAALAGDVEGLGRLLAEDAVMYTDGGGKRLAALNPIIGRDRILRFIAGTTAKRGPLSAFAFRLVTINGAPGFVVRDPDGQLETLALEVDGTHGDGDGGNRGDGSDGSAGGERIRALYSVRNPDKVAHLTWPSEG